MKIALLFLVSFVGISTPQKYVWMLPYSYFDKPIYRQNSYDPTPNDDSELRNYGDDVGVWPKSAGRFLFAANNADVNGNTQQRQGFLRTFYVTTTSTVTTAEVNLCMPRSYFAGGSASECFRRKRLANYNMAEDMHDDIDPSSVTRMVTTAEPVGYRTSPHVQDIMSSRDEPILPSGWQDYAPRRNQPQRDYRFLNFNLFPTRTLTSYIFNSTTILKTVSLGDNAVLNSQLKCVPPGYIVC